MAETSTPSRKDAAAASTTATAAAANVATSVERLATTTTTTTTLTTTPNRHVGQHDSIVIDAVIPPLPTPTSSHSILICLEDEEFLLSPSVQQPLFMASSPAAALLLTTSKGAAAGADYETSSSQRDVHRPRIPSYPENHDHNDDYDNNNNNNDDDDSNNQLNAALLGRHYYYNSRQLLQPHLNGLNYLNIATYLLNVFVSYGIGVWGLDGLVPTRWQIIISQQYETLVTPAKWSYYLWAPILVFEAMFAVAQLLPEYRARPIIQQGTSYYFFYTCLIQTTWTLFFSFQFFLFSFVSVLCAVVALASLLASQYYAQVRGTKSLVDYWLFQFPFLLHFGWMVVMATVHFSLLIRRFIENNEGIQLASDIVSLGVLLSVAAFFLTGYPSGPDFVIPLVVMWSYIGIAFRLTHPSETMVETYGYFVIVAIRNAAYFFAGTVGVIMVPGAVVWISHEYCTIQVVALAEDSFADDPLLAQHLS